MLSVRAVIFDMYQTLVSNPEEGWINLFKEICRTQLFTVDPVVLYREWKKLEVQFRLTRQNFEEPEKSPPFKSYEHAWRDCFVQVFDNMGLEGDASAAAKSAVKSMALRDAFDDVPLALAAIQEQYSTAVLSNADDDFLLPLLDHTGMQFRAVLSSEMVRAYKPDPAPFMRIMEILDIKPDEAVYVGDNQFDDVKGAKSVGMFTVLLNRNGNTLDDNITKPDYELTSFDDLLAILKRCR